LTFIALASFVADCDLLQPDRVGNQVVYQYSGFTPACNVSEWWLARTGCRDTVTGGLRRRLAAAYAHPVTGGRTQPPHPLTTIPIHFRDQRKQPFCYTIGNQLSIRVYSGSHLGSSCKCLQLLLLTVRVVAVNKRLFGPVPVPPSPFIFGLLPVRPQWKHACVFLHCRQRSFVHLASLTCVHTVLY